MKGVGVQVVREGKVMETEDVEKPVQVLECFDLLFEGIFRKSAREGIAFRRVVPNGNASCVV